MSYELPTKEFNNAASRYFALKARGMDSTDESIATRMEMLRHAPRQVKLLILEGAKRKALVPATATVPPKGRTAWDWCDSADDIREKLRVCTSLRNGVEYHLMLQDANRLAGVATEPIEQLCPLLVDAIERSSDEARAALKAILYNGGKPS